MFFIGIDPGNEKSAVVVVQKYRDDLFIKLEQFLLADNEIIKKNLSQYIIHECNETDNCFFAIETLQSYGNKFSQTLIDTAIFIGELKQLIESRANKSPALISRKAITGYWCGTANANDSMVRARMQEIFAGQNLAGIKYDLWSALAIASYLARHLETPEYQDQMVK